MAKEYLLGLFALVLDEQFDQVVQVELVLGDQAAGAGDVGRVEGGEARVAAEDAEDADPLVRAERGPLAVDRVLGPA